MKKIGILTFHNGQNYGASLQCYALLKTLQKLKCDVEIIDFRKEKNYNKNKKVSKTYIARKLYNSFYKKQLKNKKYKFENFLEQDAKLSKKRLITEETIEEYTKQYDIIIFGSDQIWNFDPKIYDRSNIFFGDFEYKGKKIAYAASFGDSIEIARENKEYIKKQLEQFEKISVREKSGKTFLDEIKIQSQEALDPTLLLTKEEWKELVSPNRIIKEKYILYYSVNCRKYSWKVAKELSKKTGLKVINLVEHPKIAMANFKNIYNEGPKEFLNILYNAEYVVTNSLHGTVFSIIFNKKLIPVFDSCDGKLIIEERKYDLLKTMGISDIITIENTKIDPSRIKNIECEDRIEELRENSIKYIEGAIQ